MKKIICLLFIFLCITGSFAKNRTKDKNSVLQGIWQICQPTKYSWSNNITIATGPYIKILAADGTYNNMAININKGSVITANGTWKQSSDSTYTEHIIKSVTEPQSSGKISQLKFKFINSNMMQLKYTIEGETKEYTEYWLRIIMPNTPQPGIPVK